MVSSVTIRSSCSVLSSVLSSFVWAALTICRARIKLLLSGLSVEGLIGASVGVADVAITCVGDFRLGAHSVLTIGGVNMSTGVFCGHPLGFRALSCRLFVPFLVVFFVLCILLDVGRIRL